MSLEILPKEVLTKIFTFLPWETSVTKLCLISKYYSLIIQNDIGFWKEMCYVRFSKGNDLLKMFNEPTRKKSTKKKKKRVQRSYKDWIPEPEEKKKKKYDDREKWNKWKKIFVKLQFPGWNKFVKRVTEKVLEIRYGKEGFPNQRIEQIQSVFNNDLVMFIDLSCQKCRELGTTVSGWGDFGISCYFIPKKFPEEVGELGFSEFIKKKLTLEDCILDPIKEDFKSAIESAKKNNNEDLAQENVFRVTKQFEKRFSNYVHEYGLEFNYPTAGECRIKKLLLKPPQKISPETIESFKSNPESQIVDFEDFVVKSMVCLRCYRRGCDEYMLNFGKRPSWGSILGRLGTGMTEDVEFVLPMYSKRVINALFLRNTGNEKFICAEGKNGYYLFGMRTS